jgi:hypothetical protein
VVRQRFVEVVAQEPSDAQAVRSDLHKLPLRADVLKEHHQLQTKEDHRIDAGASRRSVAVLYQIPDERKVEHRVQATVEFVFRDKFFEREVR